MGYATKGFEEIQKDFAAYIATVALNCGGRDKLNDKDDIASMLNVVLWECSVKYPDLDINEFWKKFKVSVRNEMASVLGQKRIEKTETMLEITDTNRNYGGKNYKLADVVQHDEMTDLDYKDGINDVLHNVSPSTAMVAMDVMRRENRGKFVVGSKQAFGEIKQYLQG